MVRLKVAATSDVKSSGNNFNSNMVRLKVMKKPEHVKKLKTYFNSNMVRLKVYVITSKPLNLFYFNSNMVRLKDITNYITVCYKLFQFQYGSIKRLMMMAVFSKLMNNFNSNMVRLKAHSIFQKALFYFISIPIWFD